MDKEREDYAADIEAVITSFNQGSMILEAVESICAQTLLPQKIIIVDDGSTEEGSLHVLKDMEKKPDFPVPVMIHYQENGGVSAARNAGIHMAQAPLVLVLDGDDRLELMRRIIEKHSDSYHQHMADALLGIEEISDARLCQWENEVVHAVTNHQELSGSSKDFLQSPTYGDGGMASAVRIASIRSRK